MPFDPFPGDSELLLLAALATLAAGRPTRAHVFLKRRQKRFVTGKFVGAQRAVQHQPDTASLRILPALLS